MYDPDLRLSCCRTCVCAGLDAASAYHVMCMVRRLAQRERTILTVIHQPSTEVRIAKGCTPLLVDSLSTTGLALWGGMDGTRLSE